MYDYKKDEEVDINDEANDFDAINAIMPVYSSWNSEDNLYFANPPPLALFFVEVNHILCCIVKIKIFLPDIMSY